MVEKKVISMSEAELFESYYKKYHQQIISPFKSFNCRTCGYLALEPNECSSCQRILCKKCVSKTSSECEVCIHPLDPKQSGKMNRLKDQLFHNMIVKCPNEHCQKNVMYEQIKKHYIDECSKILCFMGCKQRLRRELSESHYQICPKKICDKCHSSKYIYDYIIEYPTLKGLPADTPHTCEMIDIMKEIQKQKLLTIQLEAKYNQNIKLVCKCECKLNHVYEENQALIETFVFKERQYTLFEKIKQQSRMPNFRDECSVCKIKPAQKNQLNARSNEQIMISSCKLNSQECDSVCSECLSADNNLRTFQKIKQNLVQEQGLKTIDSVQIKSHPANHKLNFTFCSESNTFCDGCGDPEKSIQSDGTLSDSLKKELIQINKLGERWMCQDCIFMVCKRCFFQGQIKNGTNQNELNQNGIQQTN
eukprot:403356943